MKGYFLAMACTGAGLSALALVYLALLPLLGKRYGPRGLYRVWVVVLAGLLFYNLASAKKRSADPAPAQVIADGVEELAANAEAARLWGDDEQLEGGVGLGRASLLVVEGQSGPLHDARHLQVHGARGVWNQRCLALRRGATLVPQVRTRDLTVLLGKQGGAKEGAAALGNERPCGVAQVVAELHRCRKLTGLAGEVGEPRPGDKLDKGVEVSLLKGAQREFPDVL